jgi:CopG family nickel-responsive transcriptional regulator
MGGVTRFSVSIQDSLLAKFDKLVENENYPTRSKAISDLIRASVIEDEWSGDSEVAGAVVMVYDHHKSGLSRRLTEIQHDFHHLVISTQHVHLDHFNCLEIVVVKGVPDQVKSLSSKLRALKGVKHASLVMTTTGGEEGKKR